MNITQENLDVLNAKVTIEIEPADYEPSVTKVLDDYRKKMSVQGFRPGKVPFTLAKKMYGKSVLADELNKILSKQLNDHIRSNNLQVLGQPLPEEMAELSLEFDQKYAFRYDLGLAPAFAVDLSEKDKFVHYKIAVDDELINKYVRDFQRRYGKSEEVDVTTEKDMIYGSFYELDKSGKRKDGGVHNHSTVVIEYVDHKDARTKLIGLKPGDKLVVEPAKLTKGEADLSAMLNVPVADLDEVGKQFDLTIESIHRIDPHALDQELFDRVLGPGAVTTEAEFRQRIADDLSKHLKTDSDKKLRRDIQEKLLEKLKLELPDAFLKRWLVEAGSNSERVITAEEVERDYDEYGRYLRVQLIENEIARTNQIKVEFPEVEAHVKNNIRAQFASFGQADIAEDMLNQFAQNYLSKEEEVRRVYDELMEAKILAHFKATVKLQEKEVSFDEFVKLASNKSSKGKFMDQISNLLKF